MAGSPSAADGGAGVRPAAVLTALALAVGLAVAAAVLVLVHRSMLGGIVMAIAGGCLVLGGVWVAGKRVARLSFADAVAERAVDVTVLGAFAWAALPDDGVASAAALTALVTSYLSSYLRAKATGLGFPVAEPPLVRPLRLGLISVALFQAETAPVVLWIATAVSVQAIIREAAAVGRMEAR